MIKVKKNQFKYIGHFFKSFIKIQTHMVSLDVNLNKNQQIFLKSAYLSSVSKYDRVNVYTQKIIT